MSRDHLYDRKRMLIEAAKAERDQFGGARRVGALAAALTGAVAGGAELGCADDELGAYGGSPNIPPGLVAMQQWAGGLTTITAARPGQNMVRISLPEDYARDWTIQLGAPGVPSGAALGVASTARAEVQLRWGHHGAQETVVLDYPTRGASITVHGAAVEVAVFDPGLAGAPTATYQVWVNEGSAPRSSPEPFQPMRTERTAVAIPVLGLVNFIAPPRARAFYISILEPGNAGALTLQLSDNVAVRARYNFGFGLSANNPSGWNLIQTAWPLVPDANVLTVTNNSGDPIESLAVHWLLDLGS